MLEIAHISVNTQEQEHVYPDGSLSQRPPQGSRFYPFSVDEEVFITCFPSQGYGFRDEVDHTILVLYTHCRKPPLEGRGPTFLQTQL